MANAVPAPRATKKSNKGKPIPQMIVFVSMLKSILQVTPRKRAPVEGYAMERIHQVKPRIIALIRTLAI